MLKLGWDAFRKSCRLKVDVWSRSSDDVQSSSVEEAVIGRSLFSLEFSRLSIGFASPNEWSVIRTSYGDVGIVGVSRFAHVFGTYILN